MKSKQLGLTTMAVLTLVLGACQKSVSTPPQATPTLENNFPAEPAQATPSMNIIEMIATQTALAQFTGLPTTPTDLTAQAQTQAAGTATNTPLAGLDLTPIVVNPTDSGTTTVGTDTPLPSITPATAAAAVTTTPQPTVQTTNPGTYALQSGEFPYCIARRFNVDPGELLNINGLSNGELFDPGLVLKIPSTGHTFPGTRSLKTHPTTYTVLSGDTIYSIACQFGDVDPVNIAAVNNLTSPYTITVGQSLQIP